MNLSIHPRNWPNMKNRQKKNTCAHPKDGRNGYLKKAQEKLGIRRLMCAETRKGLSSVNNPEAFRVPGSMRLDKN
ncbi:MAG TPA: hypothetical protein PLS50_00310 [Candidatus Dojkabacteria bacterium]|nr:hypothetical protein [Candidatus Dojkabacteria bacterium]